VSRTPVREALSRLHVENLVERHPEGGFRPVAPDLQRTYELYQVRFALEGHALRLLADPEMPVDRSVLDVLRNEWRELGEARDIHHEVDVSRVTPAA
jgi:DNA-binding GntR family transcriptional regulator